MTCNREAHNNSEVRFSLGAALFLNGWLFMTLGLCVLFHSCVSLRAAGYFTLPAGAGCSCLHCFLLVCVYRIVCVASYLVDWLRASCRASSSIPSALVALHCTFEDRGAEVRGGGREAVGKGRKFMQSWRNACFHCVWNLFFLGSYHFNSFDD